MKLTTFSQSTPESVFDDWYNEMQQSTDDDVDECLEDDFSDDSWE